MIVDFPAVASSPHARAMPCFHFELPCAGQRDPVETATEMCRDFAHARKVCRTLPIIFSWPGGHLKRPLAERVLYGSQGPKSERGISHPSRYRCVCLRPLCYGGIMVFGIPSAN